MENWVLNYGKGAYKVKDFGENEHKDLHFGYVEGRVVKEFTHVWKPETYDKITDNDFTLKDKSNIEIEMEEGKNDFVINGLTEYGYGLWTRFLWNGNEKLVTKPDWMGLTRLTLNKDYSGDAKKLGDRTLAIWVGRGFYHFTSYSIDPSNVNIFNNVNYDNLLDG